jgi:hypothetical protein
MEVAKTLQVKGKQCRLSVTEDEPTKQIQARVKVALVQASEAILTSTSKTTARNKKQGTSSLAEQQM